MDLHPGEQVVFEGHPSWRALLSFYVGGVAAALAIAVVIALLSSFLLGLLAGAVLVGAVLGYGLLKRTATTYLVSTQRLYIRRGLLSKKVQQTRIDRVQNVNTEQSVASACCASGRSTSTPPGATTASSASSGSRTRAKWSTRSTGHNARQCSYFERRAAPVKHCR